MTCGNCGREIGGEARFCPYCGADPSAPGGSARIPASGTPGNAGPEAPVGGGKKKTALLIGGAAAVVAVIALVVVMASGLFSSPKKQVEAAFVKSAAAYAQAYKKLGLPDTAQWQKDKSIFQSMSLQLRGINSELIGYDLSAFNGSEIGMTAGYNGEDRYMLAEMTASLGADELLHLLMVGDDTELYFYSPQFTGDTHYGVNTETLGADLTKLTGDDSMKDLSFNLFDLVDLVMEKMDQEKMEQDITAANKALFDAVQVEKGGKEKISVNQNEVSAALYRVTVPQEALDDHIDAVVPVLLMHYLGFYEEAVLSLGVPIGDVDGIPVFPGLTYSNLIDALHYAVEELGDVELEVYVSGGCVSAVLYEDKIDGTDVKLSLFLGGGEEYVDDLRLEVQVDGQMVVIIDSTGDHGLKSGIFTDETVIKGPFPMVTSEMTLEPGKEEDNLRWKLTANNSGLSIFALDSQGTLFVKEDLIDLTLDDAALRAMGAKICSLRFNYRICRFPDWVKQPMEKAKLITRMDQLELMTAMLDIQSRAQTWAEEMEALFTARLPEELLRGITSGVF